MVLFRRVWGEEYVPWAGQDPNSLSALGTHIWFLAQAQAMTTSA